MDKRIDEKKKMWFYAAVISLAVSIFSAFTTVMSYITPDGDLYTFNIIDLLKGRDFTEKVLVWYEGEVYWHIDTFWVSFFSTVSVVSLVLAIAGLVTIRQQRPNTWQFSITITGLIGTALPALLILVAVLMLGDNSPGILRCGIYPIVSPIATLVSVLAVHRKKNIAMEERRKELGKRGQLWNAGEKELF